MVLKNETVMPENQMDLLITAIDDLIPIDDNTIEEVIGIDPNCADVQTTFESLFDENIDQYEELRTYFDFKSPRDNSSEIYSEHEDHADYAKFLNSRSEFDKENVAPFNLEIDDLIRDHISLQSYSSEESTERTRETDVPNLATNKILSARNNERELLNLSNCSIDDHSNETESDEDIEKKQQKKGEVSSIRCRFCDKRFATKWTLDAHIRRIHIGEKSASCEICGKTFFSKQELINHASVHQSETPFKCSVCDRLFKSSHYVMKHENKVHGLLRTLHFPPRLKKRFECDICGKSFSRKRTKEDHRLVHTKDRLLKCSDPACSSVFTRQDNKIMHEWTAHRIGVRFCCRYCKKTYCSEINLSNHVQKDHLPFDLLPS